MSHKHIGIGAIFILIGALILSPLDDLFVLLPLSVITETPELIPMVWAIGGICLAIGIVLVGKTFLYRYGIIGKAIARHPVVLLGSIILISIFIYLVISGNVAI